MRFLQISLTVLTFLFFRTASSETRLSAKNDDNNTVDSEVIAGLDNIYNLRFNEAETIFRNIQKSYPSDLRGFFYESI